MYFIAFNTLNGWKARNRVLHPTRWSAENELNRLASQYGAGWSGIDQYQIMDADHEPGRSILKARHGFS